MRPTEATGRSACAAVRLVRGGAAVAAAVVAVCAAPAASRADAAQPLPGSLEAESYASSSGDVRTEPTTDAGGGADVGWIASGSWLDYTVAVAAPGVFHLGLRVSSMSGAPGGAQLLSGSDVVATLAVPATGGWQTWTTLEADVVLPAGLQ